MRKPKVLLTAFGPFGPWRENASWLALVELTKAIPDDVELVTRRYPVDFDQVANQLTLDLAGGFDYAIHLGQAAGRTHLCLEAVAINVADRPVLAEDSAGHEPQKGWFQASTTNPLRGGLGIDRSTGTPVNRFRPLRTDGPAAFLSELPLEAWAEGLRKLQIPAQVSHHAGTYVCNAVYYLSQAISQDLGAATQSLLIHIPLSERQVCKEGEMGPSLPSAEVARGLRWLMLSLSQVPSGIVA